MIDMEDKIKELEKMAVQIRRDILRMGTYGSGAGIHTSPALSSTDIVTALYFYAMNVDPANPLKADRDRFILSKGHGYAVLYSALAEKGFFPVEELSTTRAINSRLQGHPVLGKTPGVDMTSGSLGNGFACGLGIALGLKYKNLTDSHVYTLLGDGECQEGVVWEAAMAASHRGASNLTAIIDYNHYQSCGKVEDICDVSPLDEKWRAFGWDVLEVDGHNMAQICAALDEARNDKKKPVCIIAHTVKGKGISFIEYDNSWHNRNCTVEQFEQAMRELDEQEKAIDARQRGSEQ